ncbi:MAG: large conductance mechanosensitive channel protein MscL [Cellulomonas sp.]|uniref:large conductance mechanosensitive channel protein MscL n=1 Tax=Cellulomonas sp. TaxID=40001 RepID=UPI0019E4E6CD|nr:large conductance mechanosensitive channel protein MscL [Cellulomonas sp.]MBF0689032.1 large conductance mechanosensitive channel protein MscL [Cellulomonas sp.]
MSGNGREGLRGASHRIRSVGDNPRVKGLAKVGQGFKDFISRGSAIELAVGVIVGAAFAQVVDALQNAFISPLIGWVFGKPNLDNLWNIGPYTWNEDIAATAQPIAVGVILNALLQFLITAAAIYFLIVLPLNSLAARRKKGQEDEPAAPAEDILLLQEIRDLLSQRLTPAIVNDTTDAPGGPGTPQPPPPAPAGPPSIPPGA